MIKYIFHLSDIHIRNGDEKYSRYYEYKNVFESLFISIKKNITIKNLSYNEALIIITGDIFHNKNNIGNYGLMLYKILIENLTKLALTIILEGNHDSLQHEIEQPSLVTSTFGIDNLIVLKETKSFIIDDIGFSYVNIRDTLDNCSKSGRKNILKPFPKINEKVKYKIALFHGTFANIKLYNGTTITCDSNPYPFEWIQDFDLALLGDIHLRQSGLYKKKLLWCYSGSLIQQNFGEDILDHGYVIWDLQNKKIEDINVFNNYGKIVLKQINDKIYFRKTNNFTELEYYIKQNLELFPKNIDIKFLSNYDDLLISNLFNKYNIKYNILSNYNKNNSDNKTEIFNNNLIIDDNNILLYFKNHLNNKQYLLLNDIIKNYDKLLFNINDYPQELHQDCLKKNKEISTFINNCIISHDLQDYKPNFTIKYMEWENLFCYTTNNWIDFSNLTSSIFIISGKNGTGKSAIYDILTLAIWGDITVNKQSDINSGIINFNCDNAYSIIELKIHDSLYKIKKEFKRKTDNNLLIKTVTSLFKFENNNYVLFKKDNAAKDYIIKLFGTINNFLSSSMITQNIDNNILKMNYKECTQLIDKAMNIEYIYNLYSLFKNSLNKYKDFHKILIAKKNVYHTLTSNYSDNDNLLTKYKNKLSELFNEKKSFNFFTNTFNNTKIDLDEDYDSKLKNFNLDDIISENDYKTYLDTYTELKYYFKNLNISYENIKKYAEKYNSNNVIPENIDINFLTTEYDFLKNYFHFNDNFNLSLSELKTNLNYNNTKLNLLKNNINLINDTKPTVINDIDFDYDIINNNIIKIFENIDKFVSFYNNNNKYNINYDTIFTDNYSLNIFNNNKSKILSLNDRLELNNNKLKVVETNLNLNLSLLNKLDIIEKPDKNIKFKTSQSTKKYINEYFKNINRLTEFNKNNKDIYDNYLKTLDIKKELELYNCDDYNYDNNCIFCKKRPWVLKINELNDKLNILNNNIDNNKLKIFNQNTQYIDKYNLYNNWYKYYLYHETKKNIDLNIKTKETYNKLIENDILELKQITEYNNNFLNITYNLFQKYQHYNNYCIYKKWLENYNNLSHNITILQTENINLEKHIEYFELIKPRIDNYYKIKKDYDLLIIYKSYLYCKYDKTISIYNNYYETLNKKNIKDNLLNKIKIDKLDNEIITINSYISKLETEKTIHNSNKNILNNLKEIEENLNNIIDIITIIIDKFKDYKKWLYDNYILKNIITNTNKFIKLLCHDNCKQFRLDYLLTENKDIIHINWLIKNIVEDEDNVQIISINQASGFQNFAISTALRLSLFSNKVCDQLFIDEGFTACDKDNLSIVPDFLKNLLQLFTSVIIVSHIDIIQDNIDDKIQINYNNKNKSSNIKFGNKLQLI